MIPDLLTADAAQAWCSKMKNADGTTGPHWPKESVKELIDQSKLDCDPDEFYAVLNSIYSVYCKALRKNNISQLQVYVDLALAWLDDANAVKNKSAVYYACIVGK